MPGHRVERSRKFAQLILCPNGYAVREVSSFDFPGPEIKIMHAPRQGASELNTEYDGYNFDNQECNGDDEQKNR